MDRKRPDTLNWKRSENPPHSFHSHTSNSSLDELSKAHSSHHQTPHYPRPERRDENWLCQAVHTHRLISLHNWWIRQIPLLWQIRRLKFWEVTCRALDTRNVLKLNSNPGLFWHKVCAFSVYICMASRCYEASFCKGLSKYLHVTVLIYLCFILCICSLRRLKYENFKYETKLKKSILRNSPTLTQKSFPRQVILASIQSILARNGLADTLPSSYTVSLSHGCSQQHKCFKTWGLIQDLGMLLAPPSRTETSWIGKCCGTMSPAPEPLTCLLLECSWGPS